jgi:transposase
MGWAARRCTIDVVQDLNGVRVMPKVDDLSCCLTALDQDSTLIAVIEMGLTTWLVGALLPGVDRQPLKKLEPDAGLLLRLLVRWSEEARKAGRPVSRICVAYEAGRDGFWLARWLRAQGIEAHVIHPTSVPVKRDHRRAKTDRLDVDLLMRSFLGWLRGEAEHCSMVAIPTLAEEDAKRPSRERETLVSERTRLINRIKSTLIRFGIRHFKPTLRKAAEKLEVVHTPEGVALPPNTLQELKHDLERLRLVKAQIKMIETSRLERIEQAPQDGPHPMIRLLAQIMGIGLETAELLVAEVLSRNLRDRRAVARYAGLTGSPDESGKRRREKGLARAGNGRVRRAMIQLAWRWLRFQQASELTQWYRQRTGDARGDTRKTLIVALARKLLIALWRLVTTGQLPAGVILRPAA